MELSYRRHVRGFAAIDVFGCFCFVVGPKKAGISRRTPLVCNVGYAVSQVRLVKREQADMDKTY